MVRFICSKKDCEFGNMICDQCLQAEPIHPKNHKNYLFQVQDFLQIQTKMQQKFIPSLAETFKDIERRYKMYAGYCENEVKEIDSDFATLFKIFFTISENAKTFLKEKVKGDQKQFGNQLKELKTGFQELAKAKNEKSFFNMLFSNNNSDEVSGDVSFEFVKKLVDKNQPLNEMRSKCIQITADLDRIIEKRISYRKSEQSIQLFDSIREDFDVMCKDMYRKFKGLIDGADPQELRQSIFNNSAINNSFQQNSPVSSYKMDQSFMSNTSFMTNNTTKRQPQTVTIDLSRNESSTSFMQNLKDSTTNFEKIQEEMSKPAQVLMKKLAKFPNFDNQKVVEAIVKFGSLDLGTKDSYFNNIPKQGPFQYDDNSVYYGHMQNNKRHGRGQFLFANGSYYEGYWKGDAPFGFGRLIKEDGSVYEGNSQNYMANGMGTYQTLDESYKYTGEWVDDKKQGQGQEWVKEQYEYKGQYQDNLFNGQGVMKFADKTVYTGDFLQSQMDGQGTFDYPNGDKYLGEVKNGKKHGNGILIFEDGRKYEGQYINDKQQGKGIFIWPDGYIFNGLWKDGQQHGKGMEIDPNGKEREGVWDNGEWQSWITSN